MNERNKSDKKNEVDKEMEEIINRIRNVTNFEKIAVDEFAPSGKWAETIAKNLGSKMNPTQLRKVFTSIKSMEIKTKGKKKDAPFDDPNLYMLIPNVAYAKGRKLITKKFYELIKTIIGDSKTGKIKTVGDFNRFVDFMTAIVAYHKEISR